MKFNDKVVLISGATGGMGEEIVKLLASKGCSLALFARREEKLKELAEYVSQKKARCIYQTCDVSKKDDVKKAVTITLKEFGRIDVAILTAGILVPNPIQTFDSSILKKSMDVNFMGIVYFIEQLLPIMKSQKQGFIAATSTLPDKRGVAGWGAYGASKAAISWLMESLRAEAKQRYNINVITIKPGSVLTPMIEGYHRKGAITAEKAAQIIISDIEKEKRIIEFPFGQVIMIRSMDMFPAPAYDALPVEESKGDGYPQVDEE